MKINILTPSSFNSVVGKKIVRNFDATSQYLGVCKINILGFRS
jgi:hypothetical protein